MKHKILKIIIFSLLTTGLAHAQLNDADKALFEQAKIASVWKYEIVLQNKLDDACGRGWGSSEALNIGLDAVKEKSAPCISAKKVLSDYRKHVYSLSRSERQEYAYGKMQEEALQAALSQAYITGSIGKYVFSFFFMD